jgi:NADPH-dependent 2,4-dienoyl-CoA reductase/sulfur reductase-like enzyme
VSTIITHNNFNEFQKSYRDSDRVKRATLLESGMSMRLPKPLDRVYAGATLEACEAALAAARDGQRVLVVTPHAFLATDLTATLRSWTQPDSPEAADPGAIKRIWYHRLREAGVGLLFQCRPVGVLTNASGHVGGLVAVSKSGLLALPARLTVDATELGVLSAIADVAVPPPTGPTRWCFELDGLADPPTESSAPETVILTPEQADDGVEFTLRPMADSTTVIAELAFGAAPEEAAARGWTELERALQTLVERDPRWHNVILLRTGDRPWTASPVPSNPLPTGLGLGCRTGGPFTDEPTQVRLGSGITLTLDSLSPRHVPTGNWMGSGFIALDTPDACHWSSTPSADVLVAGCGTSGAPAALAAAEQGARTVVIEAFQEPGGTGCAGGINTYYHGRREGFTTRVDTEVARLTAALSPGSPTNGSHWNIAIRQLVLRKFLAEAGVTQHYETMCLGILGQKTVRGVLAAGPSGLLRIDAAITVDATGDGDVAAAAGAATEMGDPRDGMVQTHNQCNWSCIGERKGINSDLGCLDNRDIQDINRGIHRRHVVTADGDGDFTGLPVYRESRRIRGRATLTLRDVLLGLDAADAVSLASTDFDQHGLQSALYARLGLLPYHRLSFDTVVPFGICVPESVRGLLVTGKAVSATREAFAFIRMQPDLQNLGYAVGLAAAMLACVNGDPDQLDISALQARLAEIGILPPDRPPSRLWEDDELYRRMGSEADLYAVLLQPPERLRRIADAALRDADPARRLHGAMALAWLGNPSGVSLLMETLDSLKNQPQASDWDRSGRPTGGYVDTPSVYWRVNQLIVLLGLANDQRALPLLCQLAADTDAGGRENEHVRLHWRRIPNGDRIVCLCTALEHLADTTAAIPSLEALLSRPGVGGHVGPPAEHADDNFPSAHLEVIVARALARCGGLAGYRVLAAYLDDPRRLLAGHAHSELCELAGYDHGLRTADWENWLSTSPPLTPMACTRYARI